MSDADLLMLTEQAAGMAASYKAGMASQERMMAEDIFIPILQAFQRAERDPAAKIPSYLMAAIIAARSKFQWRPD